MSHSPLPPFTYNTTTPHDIRQYHTIPCTLICVTPRFVPWDMDHMIPCIIIQHHNTQYHAQRFCVPFLPLSPPLTPEAPITGGRSQTLPNKHFLEQISFYIFKLISGVSMYQICCVSLSDPVHVCHKIVYTTLSNCCCM